VNCRRVFSSHSFDVHASLFAVDDAKTLVLSVMQDSKIDLSVDVDTFMD
jgi:hypothetical protein